MNRTLLTSMLLMAALFPLAARGENQLATFMGVAATHNSDVRILSPQFNTDLTFRSVSWQTQAFGAPPYWGFHAVHYFENRPEWGFLIDYSHNKIVAELDKSVRVTGTSSGVPVNRVEPLNRTFRRLEMTDGLNLLTVNAVRRWPLWPTEDGRWRVQPYVGAGIGFAFPNVETQFTTGVHVKSYQLQGPVFHALAGVNVRVWGRASIFFEYKFDHVYLDVSVPFGTQRSFANSHQFTLGPSWNW